MSLSQQFQAAATALIVGNPKASISELRTLVADNLTALGSMTLAECFGLSDAAPGRKQRASKATDGPAKASKGAGKGKGKKGPKAKAAPKAKKAKAHKGLNGSAKGLNGAASGPLNPKTPAGREQIDQVVLEHLKKQGGDKVPGVTIRESINTQYGTDAIDVAQTRTSLNRLIEQGTVGFQGKARGTTYSVA